MKRRLLALLLVLALALSLTPATAFAKPLTDLSDCEIRFDGESWKVFPIENKDDKLYAEDLHITVVDKNGDEIPSDAYDLVFGIFYWDNEKDEDVFITTSEPFSLTANDDYMHSGFGGFAAYAVAKTDSVYTGQTRPNEFMLWHKYSFNWFGANADFGEEYKRQCTWSWHDYFEIPADEMHEPVIHGIAFEDVDPQYYEITYFERVTGVPVSDDDGYQDRVYPENDPLDSLPAETGHYFARIDGKAPYYGTSYVDFDVIEAVPENDFSKCEVHFDGESWKVFPIENKDDKLYAEDLHITVVDKNGDEIPSDAYDLMFGIFYWDNEKDEDVFITTSEPFSLTANDDYMHSGFGGFAAYAVAKTDSEYTGQTSPNEFMLWHKYSFNWFGANADFGEEYKRQCTWSWHDYFEIPADEMHEPVIHGIAFEDVDPQYYEITYFERVTGVPVSDDDGYQDRVYPETDPLDELPCEDGHYFARIDGKAPYYGTSYVDFDVLGEPESYAVVYPSNVRYYDGETIYMEPESEICVRFELTSGPEDQMAGWLSDKLKAAGFMIEEPVELGDGNTYCKISSGNLAPGTRAALDYSWYHFFDIFNNGSFNWSGAVPFMTATVNIEVASADFDYLLGDADGDGEITIIDVTLIQRRLADMFVYVDEATLMNGDTDFDGVLTIADAVTIRRYLAHMKNPFEVGKPIKK